MKKSIKLSLTILATTLLFACSPEPKTSEYTSEESRLFDKRKVILDELQDVLVALANNDELDRYDYLNEDIYFEGSDNVGNGDMKVYVLEGRVIHVHSSSSE